MTDRGWGAAEPLPPTPPIPLIPPPAGPPATLPRNGWRDPEERRERATAIAVAVVLVLTAGLIALGPRAADRPHRTLPAAVNPRVLLVPMGNVPLGELAGLPADDRSEYGLDVAIAPALPLAASAYDRIRRQYVAQDLIDAMAAAHPEEMTGTRILVAITTEDIYIRDVDWDWAFADRIAGRLAVISSARMAGSPLADPWQLLRKMLTRELGFLCFRLPATSDPDDLMYKDLLSVDDLIRMDDHL